jgi:CxxC-x17-CxxC domain-containing protein
MNTANSWFPAVCSGCGKACTLPFKPDGIRKVYCRECFAGRKKKSVNPSKMRFDGFNHTEPGVWKHPRDFTEKNPY